MKFFVSSQLEYSVNPDSTLILNIHALNTAGQRVIEESLITDPPLLVEDLTGGDGLSRLVRIDVRESANLKISYNAVVETSFKLLAAAELDIVPVNKLDAAVLPYLYPSRYCQSDRLYRFANNKFGRIENGFEQVVAITEWIHTNIEYLSGSTNSQTSAYDTITELAGVCRDFAHLGIALCRALTIPARYFTGYSYKLKPADFHACFEAYLGGEWVLFDATRLAPLNGLVKIAVGRDAADAAVANIFGDVYFRSLTVDIFTRESDFQAPMYSSNASEGIVYE